MALNIPLFLVGMKILGKRQSVYTGLGIASLTLFLWLFEALIDRGYVVPFHTEQDYILPLSTQVSHWGWARHCVPVWRYDGRFRHYCQNH